MNIEQQPENLQGRLVLTVLAIALALAGLSVLAAGLLLDRSSGRIRAIEIMPSFPVGVTVGGIEQLPSDGRARGLARKEAGRRVLSEYAASDREHGVAQIPVARAMDWLVLDAERGSIPSPDPGAVPDAGPAPAASGP